MFLFIFWHVFGKSMNSFDNWHKQKMKLEKDFDIRQEDVLLCQKDCKQRFFLKEVKKVRKTDYKKYCKRICKQNGFEQPINETKFVKQLMDLPQNYCLNGIEPNSKDLKSSLLNFAKGKCSPIILVPGLTASRLTIEIKCESFKKSYSEIFHDCGWNSCDCGPEDEFCKKPEDEYLLWIPDVGGPLSILTFFEQSNWCFAKLVKPKFDLSQPIEKMFVIKVGLEIKIYGFSPNTKQGSKCGAKAIKNLLPVAYQIPPSRGFGPLIKALEYIGYISGLTLLAMPYNYYYSYRFNEAILSFQTTLKKLNTYTGKKAIVVAHSLGNLNVLYNLSLMKKELKQKLIFSFVSISAPFMGTPKSQKNLIAGSDEFSVMNGWLGFHFGPYMETITNQMSVYELSAKCPFKLFDKEENRWFQAVKKRMKYEAEFPAIDHKDSGFLFWPKVDQICHESNKPGVNPDCRMDFYDTKEIPTVKIVDDSFPMSKTRELLERFKLNDNSPAFYSKLYDEEIYKVNPEVPVILIFTSVIPTAISHSFDESYFEFIRKKKFPKENQIRFGSGDLTVPTFSNLIPALKWAFDFENKSDVEFDAKPVKFIEFCNVGFTEKSVYDKQDDKSVFEILKNDYIGLKCDCIGPENKNYDKCMHSVIIGDSNIIKLITQVLVTNEKAEESIFEFLEKISEEVLLSEINNCPNLKASIFE